MKKSILALSIFSGIFIYSQNNCDNIKTELQTVKSENDYLKKVLEINTPILESEKDKNHFRITKVTGNKTDKTITITFLVEAKDENKKLAFQDLVIVDLEGNQYNADLLKSSSLYPEVSSNVPLKMSFSFKDITDEPKIIKIFRFRVNAQPMSNLFDRKIAAPEFRDLKVNWN